MRICDLKEDEIKVGMRIRSLLNPRHIGTIVRIRSNRYIVIKWNHKTKRSEFYGNDCKCEVVD